MSDVETARFIVRRQQRGRLDLQVQQVVDRVAVFGAIEPVNAGAAGVGVGGIGVINSPRQIGSHVFQRSRVWPRHPLWRHRAYAELANHLFPGFGAGRNIVQIRILKR